MYYAPWCARSRAAVIQFTKAAQFMEGQVRFVAVNCWYPDGMCRKQYKFLFFPVFFAYHDNIDGFRYMGIQRAEFMVKFLEDLFNPLKLLRKMDEVQDFVIQHDTVVLGYFSFNSSPQPPGYKQFFYASMRVVENDPYQPVKFGIIINERLAAELNLTSCSNIGILQIKNTTQLFPHSENVTSSRLVSWIFENRLPLPVRWMVPLGVKSLTLSREINKGPAILLFHKITPLSTASQTFALFKHLALLYNQCPGDQQAEKISNRWLSLSIQNMIHQAKSLNDCHDLQKRNILSSLSSFKCCYSTAEDNLERLQDTKLNVCEICQYKPGSHRHSLSACGFTKVRNNTGSLPLPQNSCLISIDNYDTSMYTSTCCKNCIKVAHVKDYWSQSMTGQETLKHRRLSDRYVLNGLENLPRRPCDRIHFQKNQEAFPTTVIADFATTRHLANFTGSGCLNNRTLNFLSLDWHSHWMFAESLGLDLLHTHTTPVVVAFDKENEVQYMLQDKFSKLSTASFILNFSQGLLKRNLRSIPPLQRLECDNHATLCVTELTTSTFQASLAQQKDVVLLVYAGWCGFCMALSHTFLHLAHYFRNSPEILFARINGDTNDLNWEFSMDFYPTILFFPSNNKADSYRFPENLQPTLPNLIRFVLQHATSVSRLHLVSDVCSETCAHQNVDFARQSLRILQSKMKRLMVRLAQMNLLEGPHSSSKYHSSLSVLLKRRSDVLHQEIKRVRRFFKFFEESHGQKLNIEKLQKLFQESMRNYSPNKS
ncbi:thioredoxin domain-containing protein 11-like isoform X3 [Pomacea canaliculata]|nr:thioredoxin domain-containing protein 11-like isoform X3 [Pomacea canaliculata]